MNCTKLVNFINTIGFIINNIILHTHFSLFIFTTILKYNHYDKLHSQMAQFGQIYSCFQGDKLVGSRAKFQTQFWLWLRDRVLKYSTILVSIPLYMYEVQNHFSWKRKVSCFIYIKYKLWEMSDSISFVI